MSNCINGDKGYADPKKTIAMKAMEFTLSNPMAYKTAGKTGRFVLKHLPFTLNNKLNAWYKNRDMPKPPEQSFGEWYKQNEVKKNNSKND